MTIKPKKISIGTTLTLIILGTLGILTVISLSSCSSPVQKPKEEKVSTELNVRDTSMEITYALGHDIHRISVESSPKQSTISAQSFLEHQLLKSGKLEPAKYRDLLTEVSEFVDRLSSSNPPPLPSQDNATCRSPFTISLRIAQNLRIAKGCRSSETGTKLSQITRKFEFLLYSQK